MGKRKVVRTKEEEEAHQKLQREKNALRQKEYRAAKKLKERMILSPTPESNLKLHGQVVHKTTINEQGNPQTVSTIPQTELLLENVVDSLPSTSKTAGSGISSLHSINANPKCIVSVKHNMLPSNPVKTKTPTEYMMMNTPSTSNIQQANLYIESSEKCSNRKPKVKGRPKIVRTKEEQEAHEKLQKEKNALRQKAYRAVKKLEDRIKQSPSPVSSLSLIGQIAHEMTHDEHGNRKIIPGITQTQALNTVSILDIPSTTNIQEVKVPSSQADSVSKFVKNANVHASPVFTRTETPVIKVCKTTKEQQSNAQMINSQSKCTLNAHPQRFPVVTKIPAPKIIKNVYCSSAATKRSITNSSLIQSISRIQKSSEKQCENTQSHPKKARIEHLDSVQYPQQVTENNNNQMNSVPSVNNTANTTRNNEYQRKSRAKIKGYSKIQEVEVNYLGKMDLLCKYCDAKHFKGEIVINKPKSFGDCCSHGKVRLNPLRAPPDIIEQLFSGTHEKSKEFLTHIRGYNSAFSFASFNANLVNLNSQKPGPPCFKICGQIYYKINTSLYPPENAPASYGQLFIVDAEEATQNRVGAISNLDVELLKILDEIIRNNNIYAQSYQMMHEEIQNHEKSGSNVQNLNMTFINNKTGIDRGRFNVQRTNEVAAIFSTTADGDIPDRCVTVVNRRDRTLRNVSAMDPNVEPWIYPLFYPYGDRGWNSDIKQTDNIKRVTRSMYLQYRLADRDDNSIILRGGRLLQQFIVDNYVKVEKDRFTYYQNNQKKLRIEKYQGLMDHLETKASNIPNGKVGKVVILPSSFTGSPRYMMANYQDSMTIVGKTGTPDIFLTMTSNPNWKEISENLLLNPKQYPSDRPDLCARVFDLKKNACLDLVTRQGFFGEVKAHVHVIEFQKRGLPHMHLLITLEDHNKIDTPEKVDKYISAEIPDPETDHELYLLVMNNMIHGPCGEWCIVNGKCSKGFPKPFREETSMDENGYPQYRRRDTGRIYEKSNGHIVDNRWVVPYCPELLERFNCHTNTEVVHSIKSVKYLYKYIFKGHDKASVIIGENANETVINHDEITDFVEARYVSAVEGYYRIVGKHLQGKSHAVISLPVHLPKEHNIIVAENMNDQELRIAAERTSMLIEYFDLNKKDENARNYRYPDIPTQYVWNENKWQVRQKNHNTTFGRMYAVSPTEVELFHLRILLLNVKGAKSFDNLKTVNNVVHTTFTAACLALGLIEDDNEWKNAMEEAKVWMMPRRLRLLFVRILMHCQPVHPKELWEQFKLSMSEDYIRRFGQNRGVNKAYAQINKLLNKEGWDFSKFPEMNQLTNETDDEITDEIKQDALLKGQTQYDQLNSDQKNIVDYVLKLVQTNDHTNQSNCIYIDGPGGTGKTFIYSTIYNLLTGLGKSVLTMAFTGIAATLLPNGKTVHKTLGLPVPLYADSTSSIKAQSKEAEQLRNCDAFVWDESPMAPRHALEIMDRLLRDLMENDKPFGGKIVILGGDFRQLLPVKKGGTRSETVDLSIKNSVLWPLFKMFSLTKNMRVFEHEQEFARYLLDLGNGVLNDSHDNIEIPSQILADSNADIVKDTYGKVIENKEYRLAAKRAILSARNKDVFDLNQKVIDLLDESSERVYTSVDSAETTSEHHDINQAVVPEFLNSLDPPSLPPHELRLRKFTVVMLIRNLNISEGLCNGTRLLVLELGDHLLKCEILTGDKSGEIVFLNRVVLYLDDTYPFVLKRRQFPIKVAFAMTINKGQGQTFDQISVDLSKEIFSHGQLYVAFSRVKSWDSLKVYTKNQNTSTKNYVYKEIFA